MTKIRGDKTIGVTIYLYTEISLGNSLCSYLYVKTTKMSFFCVCFIFSLFSSTKSEKRRVEKVYPGGHRRDTSGSGEILEKESRREKVVQTMCTHVSK
jgi:hypothetical protein